MQYTDQLCKSHNYTINKVCSLNIYLLNKLFYTVFETPSLLSNYLSKVFAMVTIVFHVIVPQNQKHRKHSVLANQGADK